MRKWLTDTFAFAVWERNAFLALVVIAITIAFGPAIYSVVFPPQKMLTSTTKNMVASFVNEYEQRQIARAMRDSLSEDNTPFAFANPYDGEKINPRFNSKAAISYFPFDPNKIGVQEWVQLGFSEKQAEAIERIKSKGFKFYKPEDLARLNIIGDKNAARLSPYVQIVPIPFPKRENDKPTYAPVPREKFVIDVNAADSSLWECPTALIRG
jgi:competence protein ComEA